MVFLFVPDELGRVASRELPQRYRRFFRGLGHEIRAARVARELSQEDMITYGFSLRHWQKMESGSPITVTSLLRVCDAFEIPVEQLVSSAARLLRERGKE